MSVACSKSGDAGLAPQLLAEEERRVGADRDLDAGDRLGGVPVRGELLGLDLQVQLRARARGLGHDRVGVGRQPLDAADVDRDVLAAGGEDLLVEQPVARVGAEGVCGAGGRASSVGRMPIITMCAPTVREPLLGVVEAARASLLELGEHAAGEPPRRRR